ncbi:metal-dependent hydrolase [Tenacibaculum ovolyticum]|jgi:inner membrane protein|uniref:metal-dependent hydrolase n=1 Tax=Tenacibaculum ovolyticum TaxID=104270 RepID=UPI0007EC8577|nr:metal-dependent hydrolase [Tenacibaculum ovolyticum]WBX76710.1 metal-dependent hydrolase [Tenacibaculum ovolyticum]
MASIFGHALAAFALGKGFSKTIVNWKFILLGIICAIIPDADVIGFSFGIKYESFWGHRGFSHSLLFALILGVLITVIFYSRIFFSKKGVILILYFTICTASHAVLDALTTGGLGVAFFSPFDTTRYFFPWRPIKVSPIGVARFFSDRGIKVVLSELIWIGIPSIFYIFVTMYFKRNKK